MSDQADKILDKIKSLLKSLPETSGVYKMKDETGTIIYIGKAKNLRSRVGQYFGAGKDHTIKVKKMVEKITDVEYIETNGEYEALLLETNLIKEFRPRYNILMRDDKNYVYIKVSVNEDYPRLSIVRRREKDGAVYFGPRTSADACEKLLNILRKIFPVRTCTLEMEDGKDGLINITKKTIPVPCLDYHIKRCLGPCINEIKKEQYNELIKQIMKFLKGSYQDLITRLKYKMFESAKNGKFEDAAKIRDQIKGIESMFQKQLVSDPEFINRDVIGVFPDFDKTFINLFQFREGKLINQENFTLETPQNVSTESDEERTSGVVESFLRSYYSETSEIPAEIFLRDTPLEKDLWEEWLTQKRTELLTSSGDTDRKKVHLLTPIKGKKVKILELSEKNAATFARQSRAKWMSDAAKTTQAARDLADELGLEKDLSRIECYDISHTGGEDTTASMVVFRKGSPEKKLYRHFKLKTLEAGEVDDYKALEEILSRRLQRLSQTSISVDEKYEYKKPLKKDQEIIKQALADQHLLPEKIDFSNFVGLYHAENGESRLVGYTYFVEHGEQIELGQTWIETEHHSRALMHQLWFHLLEKIKTTHVYAVAKPNTKEDFFSFGFTELKKVPEFLSVQEEPFRNPSGQAKMALSRSPEGVSDVSTSDKVYVIYKVTKKASSDESFSQIPDLIIVDGGKGQLSSALKAVKASGLPVSIVGLAKQEEEIFMPDGEITRRILLPRNSQALYLVQRIRDESHRFANELRKKLGGKKLTDSEIDTIPGIGNIIKRRLLKEYGSINAIKAAPMEQLEKTVGSYLAKMLKERLQ